MKIRYAQQKPATRGENLDQYDKIAPSPRSELIAKCKSSVLKTN